jgi:hypothetical protein
MMCADSKKKTKKLHFADQKVSTSGYNKTQSFRFGFKSNPARAARKFLWPEIRSYLVSPRTK